MCIFSIAVIIYASFPFSSALLVFILPGSIIDSILEYVYLTLFAAVTMLPCGLRAAEPMLTI